MPLSPGQVLNNRYRIVKLLGQGGFGAVYRAWDINLSAPFALKENYDASPEAVRQFAKEASMLANLRHPNLPKVIDHFSIPGQGQYLVMEYIEGQDLQEMLNQAGRPLSEAQVLAWIGQVCDALSYLHSRMQPIIHRDLKPANIRITPDGQAVLVDFGIAKVYDPAKRTGTAARAVTPGYSPIDQYTSTGSTDARADIYALGATLFALLTGQTPPEAPERNLGIPVPTARSLNPSLSQHVESALIKSLEMQPGDRWQSAAEFNKAISAQSSIVSHPQPAVHASAVVPTSTLSVSLSQPQSGQSAIPGRKWLFVAAGILMVAALLWADFTGGNGGKDDLSATQTARAEIIAQTTENARPTRNSTSTNAPTTTWTLISTKTPLPTETPPELPTEKFTPTATALIVPETFTPVPPSISPTQNSIIVSEGTMMNFVTSSS